ncbi:MAG: sodium/proline symporter [Woeseiaceae bacterium]|nr:sodium/proline symporter [Woeseiaceae bacterium]
MSGTVIAFLVLYYVIVLGIGYWAMRHGGSKDLEGYLLGGRQVGPMATALTLQSTSMSGYMFLGAGGLGYTQGYWAMWFAAGDIGGGVLNLSSIGRRMRKLSQMFGALTSIEYLEKRYPSPAVRLFAGVLTVFLLGFYVLAQLIAGGKGMAMVTGLPYPIALAIAVGIILIYTFMGGYLAVAYTDFFQSLVMLVGVLWIAAAALSHVGGLTAANNAIAEFDPTLLSIWGKDLGFEGQWGIAAGAVLIFSVGLLGWPHVVTRHMAMSRPATARKAGMWATAWNLFFVPTPYLVGILAVLILPELNDPEMAIFEVAGLLLPPAVTGLVMAAIMAAIMSTADSLLLQTGSIASRDLYERFINPRASERQMVMVSRGLVLAIALIGYVVALYEPPTVFAIVIFATSVLGSAFLPAYFCAVWWKKANAAGALSSMVVGASVAFSWEFAGMVESTQMAPMTAGVASSITTMIVVSLLTQKLSPVPAHIHKVMDEAATVGPIPEALLAASDTALGPEASAIESKLNNGDG